MGIFAACNCRRAFAGGLLSVRLVLRANDGVPTPGYDAGYEYDSEFESGYECGRQSGMNLDMIVKTTLFVRVTVSTVKFRGENSEFISERLAAQWTATDAALKASGMEAEVKRIEDYASSET